MKPKRKTLTLRDEGQRYVARLRQDYSIANLHWISRVSRCQRPWSCDERKFYDVIYGRALLARS